MTGKRAATARVYSCYGGESKPVPVEESTLSFKNATRIQESVTSRMERKALVWLAARMPSWIHSDHLTLIGFAAMFLAGLSYLSARWNLCRAAVCDTLSRTQLVRRQSRRDPGAPKKSRAPSLRLLRGPYDRLVRSTFPHGWPWCFYVHRLADCNEHADSLFASFH